MPKVRFVANTADVAIAAALSGEGITRVLSYMVEPEVKAGRLRILLPKFGPPSVPIHVVHAEGRKPPAKVRAFVDLAVERLREKRTRLKRDRAPHNRDSMVTRRARAPRLRPRPDEGPCEEPSSTWRASRSSRGACSPSTVFRTRPSAFPGSAFFEGYSVCLRARRVAPSSPGFDPTARVTGAEIVGRSPRTRRTPMR